MDAKPRYLIFSVDTEPDNLWSARPAGHVYTHENIAGIKAAVPLLKQYGVKPVFLISYSVAHSGVALDILTKTAAELPCETGSHFHPCDTPPYTAGKKGESDNILRLSDTQLEQKFSNLHRSIVARFGEARSFRAGAWTIDSRTLSLIKASGYRCDSSVTPGISWALLGRPSYVGAPRRHYYLDERNVCAEGPSGVLEVPVSIRAAQNLPGPLPAPVASLFTMPFASQKGLLPRTIRRMKRFRPLWLRPAFQSLDEMKTIAAPLLAETGFLHVMVHSTELACGTSPYVTTEAERNALLERLEGVIKFALLLGCMPVTMTEFAGIVSGRTDRPDKVLSAQSRERETLHDPVSTDEGNKPAPDTVRKKSRRGWVVLRWAVSAAVFGVLLSRIHLSSLLGVGRSAEAGLVAMVLCLSVLNQFCSAAKLTLILSPISMTFAKALRLTFISTFFNTVLPSGGSEVVRMLYINKEAGSAVISASAVVIDRLTSLFTQILIILFSIAFFSGAAGIVAAKTIAAIALAVVIAALLFLFVCPAGAFSAVEKRLPFQAFWKGKTGLFFLSILSRRPALVSIMGLSVLYNCIVIAMVLLLTAAFSGHVRFMEAAIVVFCGSIGTVLPVSIGGLGVVEAIYAAMFKVLHNHKETGLAVSLGLRVAALLPVCIGFFLFILREKRKRPPEAV